MRVVSIWFSAYWQETGTLEFQMIEILSKVLHINKLEEESCWWQHGGAVGSAAASQLQGPPCNPVLILLPVWSFSKLLSFSMWICNMEPTTNQHFCLFLILLYLVPVC